MSTSLALQLKKLTVPQTSVLRKDDRKRLSLLFDPKEAANINRDTFYKIGLEGLEELIERDQQFEYFRNNLFHIAGKDFERSIEDTKENNKLNKLIKHFLLCLTPYFMLHCSYKALEWLIYRYHICQYNKKDVLMLILPYHETNIFARTLQLLNLKENDEWHWLQSLKKPGAHLPKLTLYGHAASSSSFIRFIAKTIKLINEKKINASIYYNFYCVSFTGALEYSDNITENLVTEMVPCILKGLISNALHYLTSTYIILAKLLGKITLSDKLLMKFVDKITEFPLRSAYTEAIMLLVILFQKQSELNTFGESIQKMIENIWIVSIVQNLQNSGTNITPFLKVLFTDCMNFGIDKDDSDARMMCMELLVKLRYKDEFVRFLICEILKYFKSKKEYTEDVNVWIQCFMQKLETLHPSEYDAQIMLIMKNNDGEFTKLRKRLKKFIDNSIMIGGHYDIFEKMYHPDFAIRKKAMKYVIKEYDRAKDREKQFLRTSILQHLQEDDSEIVFSTLQITAKILPQIIEHDKLKHHLYNILDKPICDEVWFKSSTPALEILCSIVDGDDVKCFLKLLPYLLPTDEKDVALLRTILNSSYATKNAFLKNLPDKIASERDPKKLFDTIYNSLKKNLANLPPIQELLTVFNETQDNAAYKYITVLLITNTLPKDCSVDVASQLLDVLINYMETVNLKLVKNEKSFVDYIRASKCKHNKLSLQSVLFCIDNIIAKVKEPDVSITHLDFSEEIGNNKFYLRLMDVLLKGHKSYKYAKIYDLTMDKFMERFVTDFPSRINVYLNMCLTESQFIGIDFQVTCLEVALENLQREKMKESNNMLVPYFLACTSHSNVDIRRISLNCLATLSHSADAYKILIDVYLSYEEEIVIDQEQAPIIIIKVFNKMNSNKCWKMMLDALADSKNPICFKRYLTQLFSKCVDTTMMEGVSIAACQIFQTHAKDYSAQESQIIYYNSLKFENEDIAKHLELNSNTWLFIKSALGDFKNVLCEIAKTPAQIILESVNATFYSNLTDNLKKELLSLIINIGTFATNPDVISEMNHFIRKIDLDMSLLIQQLKDMKEVQSPKTKTTPKKRRVATIPTPDILDTTEWKKGLTVLEVIQDKKKIRYHSNVLTVLFEILKKCLDFDEQSTVEYPKQLLLSNILHCCSKLSTDELKENNVDIVLVVQCIRASQNPQTHHHALLVLAQTAAINPKQVLHHIMTIFTFMGSSVLRHDDAYSLQIITKIIDTIIPILMEDSSIKNIINVLRVFVDVILDVPEHRRIPMYKNLLTRLNPATNLHLFLLLMFESHVMRPDKKTDEELPKRLQICQRLCMEFSPATVIESCIKLMQYIHKLPEEKPEVCSKEDLIFDVTHKTQKQYRHYKYTIVTFTTTMLSLNEFVLAIVELEDENLIKMETLYKDMIINTLTFIQSTAKTAQKNVHTNQVQYWKVLLHLSYDILDSINALLTPKMFLLVIKGLMVHSLPTVKRRAIELLNTKLQHNESAFDDCDENELYTILPSLINIVKIIDEEDSLDSEEELIVQTALLALKLLVRILSPKSPEKFVVILNFLTDLLKKSKGNLLASLLLCIAELCHYMKAHSIQNLNKLLPCIVKVLKIHKQETSNLLLLSSLTALSKILDSLPLFLSPFLEKILSEFSTLNCKFNLETDDPKVQPIVSKIAHIKEKIGNLIPLRVLIPNLTKVYDNKVNSNDFEAIEALMDILTKSINSVQAADLQNNSAELNTFYMGALDFRIAAVNVSNTQTNALEAHVVNSFISYIMKLSESTFKPIYYKIYDWAIRGEEVKKTRIITFYHLSSKMAERLKGLFVHFAGHFISNAANVLNSCNKIKSEALYFEDDTSNMLLLEYILKTLLYIFTYDSQKFLNKERFGVLMQPIVDQLENDLEDVDDLEERAENLIIPCLVHFSVATGNDALWKQSNYQILLKMRHNNPRIRIIALRCLTEIAKKLGEDFLPLLPETIPFLAELLEDEDENVEKSCQKAVQEMEKTLGEPLQKYF